MSNSTAETKRKARRAAYMRDWRKRQREGRIQRSQEAKDFLAEWRRVVTEVVRAEFDLHARELRADIRRTIRAELAAEAKTPSG